jgi:hypothetical protein
MPLGYINHILYVCYAFIFETIISIKLWQSMGGISTKYLKFDMQVYTIALIQLTKIQPHKRQASLCLRDVQPDIM